MEKHYIYKLTSPSGKVYIGRTKNFKRRLYIHQHKATSGYQHPLYDSIRKHGWENFHKEVIAEVDESLVYETELLYIKLFDSVNKGLNLQYNTENGGDVWTDRRDTEEYREFTKRMRTLNLNGQNPTRGKHHSAEAIEKQKQAAKGRYSLEWFIDRYGDQQGPIKYEERRTFLKNRNLKKDEKGRFITE